MYSTPTTEDLTKILEATEFFNGVQRSSLFSLVKSCESVSCESGHILMRQGELESFLLIIVHGRVRVYKDYEQENQETVAELGPGEIIGEVGLLVDQPRVATVIAIRDSLLMKFSREEFNKFIINNTQTGMAIAKKCIERLTQKNIIGKTNKNIKTVSFFPLTNQANIQEFLNELMKELAHHGSVIIVDDKLVSQKFSNIERLSCDLEKSSALIQWLQDLENQYQYVVYIASQVYDYWSKLCLQQADAVYIINDETTDDFPTDKFTQNIFQQNKIKSRIGLILLDQKKINRRSKAQAWISNRNINDFHHVNSKCSGDIKRIIRFIIGTSTGVVLSGGGARGMAHVGVIRALEQANIPIDIIGGTSQGALMSAAYAISSDSYGLQDLCVQVMAKGGRLDYTFPYISIAKGRQLSYWLHKSFGDLNFEDLKTRIFCMSTDITHNEARVHDVGCLWKALRASVSIPGIYPPVLSKDTMLVDGGILNNLPVEVMSKKFNVCSLIASEVLVTDNAYTATFDAEYLSGWHLLWNKFKPFNKNKDLPKMGTILMRTVGLKETKDQEMQAGKADYCFSLDLSDFMMLDFHKQNEIIETGYKQAMSIIEKSDIKKLSQ